MAVEFETTEQSRFAPAAVEDLLLGSRRLHSAFLSTPIRLGARNQTLVRAGEREPPAVLVRHGFAFRSQAVGDGQRAILDIMVPGDFGGLDNMVMRRPLADITAAERVGYHLLPGAALRDLMSDRSVALYVASRLADSIYRRDRLAASLGRLDAHARICIMLLDIHDRLRRRNLISRPTFNLPLRQEEMADCLGLTLVHVNRTLRRLREEKILLLDRHVVIIMDLERLRLAAEGLPRSAESPLDTALEEASER